jgi:hypothetical protein
VLPRRLNAGHGETRDRSRINGFGDVADPLVREKRSGSQDDPGLSVFPGKVSGKMPGALAACGESQNCRKDFPQGLNRLRKKAWI